MIYFKCFILFVVYLYPVPIIYTFIRAWGFRSFIQIQSIHLYTILQVSAYMYMYIYAVAVVSYTCCDF